VIGASAGPLQFLRRVALYCVPLGLFVLLCWQGCGADMWALHRMVPVQGVLDTVDTVSRSASWARVQSNTVLVSYRYVVAGQQYHGENMVCCRVMSNGSMLDPLQDMRDQLRPLRGERLTVWVDPSDPQRAVLFRYVPNSALLLMGFGLVFGYFSLRTLDRHLRQRWQEDRI